MAAPLTWKNVGTAQRDTGGLDFALKALESGSKSLQGAAQVFVDRDDRDRGIRTADTVRQKSSSIKSLEDLAAAQAYYSTPEGEASLGDINTQEFHTSLAGQGQKIRDQREIAAQETMRGFAPGIALDPLDTATLGGQQAKVDQLRQAAYSAGDLSPQQKEELFTSGKAGMGINDTRSKELAYRASIVTDPVTGAQVVDPNLFKENMASLGFGPEARMANRQALEQESGQAQIKADARAAKQRDIDLSQAGKIARQSSEINSESAHRDRGSSKNITALFDRLTDTDYFKDDARKAGVSFYQDQITAGVHPNVAYDAMIAGIEHGDDFDTTYAKQSIAAARKSGYLTQDRPFGAAPGVQGMNFPPPISAGSTAGSKSVKELEDMLLKKGIPASDVYTDVPSVPRKPK